MILLFNMDMMRQGQLAKVAEDTGLSVKSVDRKEMWKTIGVLAELPGFAEGKREDVPVLFSDEMMIFAGVDSDKLDAFLLECRKKGIPSVSLKAVLTEFNSVWSAMQLYLELKKEHAEMNK